LSEKKNRLKQHWLQQSSSSTDRAPLWSVPNEVSPSDPQCFKEFNEWEEAAE